MQQILDQYTLNVNDIIVQIRIINDDDKSVPEYNINITNISDTTKLILEKLRQEFVSKVNVEELTNQEYNAFKDIKEQFQHEIKKLIKKYFPQADEQAASMLTNYLLEENLGLGKIEVMLKDKNLEEIVVNNHTSPIWVYHRRWGWLETNVRIYTEARIRHFSTMIGRNV